MTSRPSLGSGVCALALFTCLAGCALPGARPGPPVVLVPNQANAVARWHDIAAAVTTAPPSSAPGATEAERIPVFPADMATVHLAIYDAVLAIEPRYRPVLFAPSTPEPAASMEAATAAAAYQVLRSLFPSHAARYQGAYEGAIAAIPEGPAKARGLALGAASAAAHLARRAADGRAPPLPPYVPSDAPGRFRGKDPINRALPQMRPFTLQRVEQFRPAAPPALGSAAYAADLNEVRELGGQASTRRLPEQLELARFFSEPPARHFTRNLGRFARTSADPLEAARVMAALYTAYSDALSACMEAKYYFDAWRPVSAIPLADCDNNPATLADPSWTPVLPTPNHPEYPAAHSCTAGSVGEVLRQVYRTDQGTFTWDSLVTHSTRTYTDTDALAEDGRMARIHGGMHFRFSTAAGATLGRQVADWTMRQAFPPRR